MEKRIEDICSSIPLDRMNYRPVAPEIVMTSSFHFSDFAEYAAASKNQFKDFVYTRGSNPTTLLLEEKLAELECGERCKVFASGMGAISAALVSCLKQGDHVLFVNTVYSTTLSFIKFMTRYGITWTVVNTTDVTEVANALKTQTKIIYFESPSTQKFELIDLDQVACLAQSNDILTIMDNTWATPVFQNPLNYGIDLVIHSCSKYIGGHSDIVCGAVIGSQRLIEQIERSGFLYMGATCSPMNSFLALRGLRTLPIRMQSQQENALEIVTSLQADPRIEKIFHPYCADNTQKQLSQTYLRGYSSLFAFQMLSKELTRFERFINELNEFILGVSWGGYESMILPVYKGNNQQELKTRGLDVTHTRMYVGLSHPKTLIRAIQNALDAAYGICK